jgi:hypothetical protein
VVDAAGLVPGLFVEPGKTPKNTKQRQGDGGAVRTISIRVVRKQIKMLDFPFSVKSTGTKKAGPLPTVTNP